MILYESILVAIVFCLLFKTNNIIGVEENWNKWNCEDLIFDECQLDVIEGEIKVRGLTVHYWKYTRSKHDVIAEDTEDLPLSPIIFIHGGPSLPHNYALPLKKQACRGRDIVFYDQAGCGESSIPNAPEDDTFASEYRWLLDINYYAKVELPLLISQLGYEKFHIIGHSWGSMIAQVFALDGPRKIVEGIQSITLAGPQSDIKLYAQAQWDPKDGSITKLPQYLQNRIRVLQDTRQFDSEEYVAIVDTYCALFLTRTQPVPSCVADSLTGVNTNIYFGLYGKDEFSIGGTIKDWNVTDRIHEIKVPVLLTTGQHDIVRPSVVDVMQNEFKHVERALFSKSAHLSMIDEPDRMNEVIQDFLDRVEKSIIKDHKFKPIGLVRTDLVNDVEESEEIVYSRDVLVGSCITMLLVGAYAGFLIYRWNQEFRYSIPRTNSGTLKKGA